MKPLWVTVMPVLAGGAFALASSLVPVVTNAQGPAIPQRTVKDGVFTVAQADRGKQAYEANSCTRCHLNTLEGREQGGGGNGGAPLKGLRFIQDFGENKLSTLVNKMRLDKPMENPGTLSDQVALDIAAYILLRNDYPPGQTDLTNEAASQIWIPGPAGATGIPNHTIVSSVGCLYHDPSDSWLLTKALALTPSAAGAKSAPPASAAQATHTFRLLDAYNRNPAPLANHIVKVEGYLVRLGAEIRVSLTSLEQAGGSCAKAGAADATIWSGVFSEIQARRGERVASVSCSGCHGPDLEGGDSGPKLVGPTFLTSWREKTVGDLFAFVKTEMPADAPDSLSPQGTANVIAYILELNKSPAGTQVLPVTREELNRIKIVEQMPVQ